MYETLVKNINFADDRFELCIKNDEVLGITSNISRKCLLKQRKVTVFDLRVKTLLIFIRS